MILNYQADPVSWCGSLKSDSLTRLWSEKCDQRSERQDNAGFEAEGRGHKPSTRTASRSWKRQGNTFPPESREGRQPHWHIDFSPVRLMCQTSDLQQCDVINTCVQACGSLLQQQWKLTLLYLLPWWYFCTGAGIAEALVPQVHMGSGVWQIWAWDLALPHISCAISGKLR